jgi:hypothetical protein
MEPAFEEDDGGADSRTLYADEDDSENVVTHYLTDVGGPNRWLARVDGNGSAWLLSDHLGSVRVVTDATASVVRHALGAGLLTPPLRDRRSPQRHSEPGA